MINIFYFKNFIMKPQISFQLNSKIQYDSEREKEQWVDNVQD
jgi:hypothetical protein